MVKAAGKHATARSFPAELLKVRVAQVVVDVVLFAAALVSAYLIRFEGELPEWARHQMLVILPYIAGARFLAGALGGAYRVVWRYVGVREALRFAKIIGGVSALLLLARVALPDDLSVLRVPIGIIVLEGVFSYLFVAGIRFARRLHHESSERRQRGIDHPARRTLLIGAGEAGLSIAKEASRSADLGIHVIGFLDDDTSKSGMEIHGTRVLGAIEALSDVLDLQDVDQVFITTTRIPSARIREIAALCRGRDIPLRIVPALYEILGSSVEMRMLREIRIEDLLSRDPVKPSLTIDDLRRSYADKCILVTGAGGSIGSELCRQLVLLRPRRLILAERDETNLFHIDRALAANDPGDCRVPMLVDVADRAAMTAVFDEHRPEIVFHAAAYKHVPLMEEFPDRAVKNNVVATSQLVDLCQEHGSERFVMISTDKAVNPTNVMGATKRVAEMVVQKAARDGGPHMCSVRFGNVLGSRGSVVGIFKEQIRKGGPVTVTHPDVTRYFMTVQEAVNLVLQTGTIGDDGDVYLLDMGTPVKIVDLAREMIRLSGFSEAEIPIEFTGFRPGEKMFEELSVDAENIGPTSLRKVHRVCPPGFDAAMLARTLDELRRAAAGESHGDIRRLLTQAEIGYVPSEHKSRRVTSAH